MAYGLAFLFAHDARAEDFVAVSSKVSNTYVRTQRADGSFEPETYAFKEGGYLGSRISDDTIDKITFPSVAQTIAGSLASRSYLPSVDPEAAKLLIVIYWGTSRAPAETSKETPISLTADISGPKFSPPALDSRGHPPPAGIVPFREGLSAGDALAFGDRMVSEEDAMMLGYETATDPELKEYRYFVVLLAYDLQALLKEKKQILLWQTRFSMGEHRNQFDLQLKPMVVAASAYFGRDSFGLKRGRLPEGRVEIGTVRSVGGWPDPSTSAVLAPDGGHVAYLTKGDGGLRLTIADIDRQESHPGGEVPDLDGRPVQLAWVDGGRIVVRLPSTELLIFNDRGQRVETEARNLVPNFSDSSRAKTDESLVDKVQALVEEKLPNRKVVVLGSDQDGKRYLLSASDQSAFGRYFVYDRPNDLLYEIGRGFPAQ